MQYPQPDIESILFGSSNSVEILGAYFATKIGMFDKIDWLNTPGPIYTTYTDNCGTGQIAAIHNVGGDADYHEVIFKQPFTKKELEETLIAAFIDPFDEYYFDGNQHWTQENILVWWNRSAERVSYIIERYDEELNLPFPLGRSIYGPPHAIPENYKFWLDFYQQDMKAYLEWYIYKLHQETIELPTFEFDWSKKYKLDQLFYAKGRIDY